MSFSPLGRFDPNVTIDRKLIDKALEFGRTLPRPPAAAMHGLNRIYAHWTVSACNCDFTDYNGETKLDAASGLYTFRLEHNPLDEIPGLNNDPEIAGTWHRNTGSIACAITGMDAATENDFGPDAVTVAGLQNLCAMMAAFARVYFIGPRGRVAGGSTHLDNNGNSVNTRGEWNLLTHGEVAVIDAYPSERWDLGSFVPLPSGEQLTPAMRSQCGDALRTLTERILFKL